MALFLEKRVSQKLTSLVALVALLIFLPFLLLVSYQTVRLVSRALGTPASIVVDTTSQLESIRTDFFHSFAQGGEESNDMLASVLGEVRTLKPRLIRVDHIYDHYDVVSRNGSELSYHWSRLDEVVSSILATGAKPMIALSFMPAAIARDGSIISPPNNWDEWAAVVQKTIEHFSGRGERNIAGIYYEVWNEPDLAQFGKWTISNYVTLYRYAAQGARSAQNVNGFLLGGPATTGLYKNWILALVGSGARIDFLSWHSYLSDPRQFARDQTNITTWLLPYPNHVILPKIISEFGFTGAKDKRYGTTYASAHTAAVIRQLIAGGPRFAMSFQLKDGPNQQDGSGWGLITHDDNGKKPKPRYWVYNFLDSMVGTRLPVAGEGTWVTGFATTKENVIRLALINFDPAGSHSENVPVTFAGLLPGTYSIRERFLLGRDTRVAVTTNEGTLSRQVFMPSHSVAIIELAKQ